MKEMQNGECELRWNGWKRGILPAVMILVGVMLGGSTPATGQTSRERILDEPFRLELDERQDMPAEKRALLDWGGLFRSNYWEADDNVDRDRDGVNDEERSLWRQQLKVWGLLDVDRGHRVYARMMLDYYDWVSGEGYSGREDDWDGPRLERGWYDFRLGALQRAYGEDPCNFDLRATVGRQYVEFGSGFVLAVPMDAVQLHVHVDDWEVTGLLGMAIPSTDNIDRSSLGRDTEEREFWGVQLEYHRWPDHEPFIYYFGQEDGEAGQVCFSQTFAYDSMYLGFGSRGRFFERDWQYTVEVVLEHGESTAKPLNVECGGCDMTREDICAWSFDTELRYISPDEHRSQVAVEYLLASGDPDRRGSAINTIGGNVPGSRDTGFFGWGYRNTGLSFAPRISNLGMGRLAVSTYPAERGTFFENVQVGSDFYVYHKQRAGGAADDNLSTEDAMYLGSEVDLYANWRMCSDVAVGLHYGIFFPGDAFRSQKARQVWYAGVTINF